MAQVEQNRSGVGCGGLRALVLSPGHYIRDGGHEGAYRKGVRRADRGDHGDAGGAQPRAVLLSCPLFMRGRAPSINLGMKIEDADVFRDAIKLGVSYSLPVRLGGTQLCLDTGWKSWIEIRLFRALFQFNDWDEWPSASSASQSRHSLGFRAGGLTASSSAAAVLILVVP